MLNGFAEIKEMLVIKIVVSSAHQALTEALTVALALIEALALTEALTVAAVPLLCFPNRIATDGL
jgi:hypothetical protein